MKKTTSLYKTILVASLLSFAGGAAAQMESDLPPKSERALAKKCVTASAQAQNLFFDLGLAYFKAGCAAAASARDTDQIVDRLEALDDKIENSLPGLAKKLEKLADSTTQEDCDADVEDFTDEDIPSEGEATNDLSDAALYGAISCDGITFDGPEEAQ